MREDSRYGICRISVVSMKLEPDHRSELVNQLLFGEHYTVLKVSEDTQWFKVQSALDRYEGWIQKNQFYEISAEYFDQVGLMNYKICTDLFSSILFNKTQVNITIGSILPISSYELFEVDQHLAFNGEAKSLGQKRDYYFVENISKKYINSPYMWGGKTPFGIDCSGFTQMVFRIAGYPIPRDSSQQAFHGKHIEEFSQAKPGDLAVFTNENGKIDHVGILLEDNNIIHASGRVRIDFLDPEGIINVENKVISHYLHSFRRVMQ